MPGDESKASHNKTINWDDWLILNAKKIKHRSDGSCKRSRWEITLLNIRSGHEKTLTAFAEHRHHPGIPRNHAYYSSSSAAVKNLVTLGASPTCFILKSFLPYDTKKQYELLIHRMRKQLTSVDYLQIFGCPAITVVRKKTPRGQTKEHRLSLSIVMAKLGSINLKQALNSQSSPLKNTPRAKLEVAFCRLLAYTAFFHQQERRPILDLKPANIIPIIRNNKVVDLKIIDLEGSIGRNIVITPASMHEKDANACFVAMDAHNNAYKIDPAIDIRSLGMISAELFGPTSDITITLNQCHDGTPLNSQFVRRLFAHNREATVSFNATLQQCQLRSRYIRPDLCSSPAPLPDIDEEKPSVSRKLWSPPRLFTKQEVTRAMNKQYSTLRTALVQQLNQYAAKREAGPDFHGCIQQRLPYFGKHPKSDKTAAASHLALRLQGRASRQKLPAYYYAALTCGQLFSNIMKTVTDWQAEQIDTQAYPLILTIPCHPKIAFIQAIEELFTNSIEIGSECQQAKPITRQL
jgi:hypothetical protein